MNVAMETIVLIEFRCAFIKLVLVAIWHPLALFAGANKTNVAYNLPLHTLEVFFIEIL